MFLNEKTIYNVFYQNWIMTQQKIPISYEEVPDDEQFRLKIKRCELELGNQFFNLDDEDDFAQLPLLNQNREIKYQTVRNIHKISLVNNRLSDFIDIEVTFTDKFDEVRKGKSGIPKEMIKIKDIETYDSEGNIKDAPIKELKFRPVNRPKI